MAKKKFIIIQPGTKIFPEKGKKRVRVFQDDEYKGVPPGLLDELKQYGEVTEDNTKKTKENTQANQDNVKAQNVQIDATRLSIKQTEDLIGVLDRQLRQYAQLEGVVGEYARAQSDIVELERELMKAQAEGIPVKADLIQAQLDQAKATVEAINKRKDLTDQEKAGLAPLKALSKNLREVNDAYLDQADKIFDAEEKLEKYTDTTRESGFQIMAFSKGLNMAGLGALDMSGGIDEVISSVAKMGDMLNKTSIELEKNTNLGEQAYTTQKLMVLGGTSLGISNEQAAKTQVALNKGMSSFVSLTREAQANIAETTVVMERLGVSAEVSAKAIDLMDRSMGMSATGAAEALKDFDKLGQELSLPTGQLVEDFTKLGPKLARFGKDGKKQFEMLAKEARKLGVEVGAAFDVAEAFDTFEGAADMAGKLNAQLGLQINSVEMLGATHAERIELLRQEFAQSGKNFDQLGRRQKQAVAEMMGIDVDMASKLFGDPVAYENFAKQQEEAEERAKRLTSVADKFATIADRVAVVLSPILDYILIPMANAIAYIFGNPIIATGIALYTGYLGVMKSLAAFDVIRAKLKGVEIGQMGITIGQQQVSNGLTGQATLLGGQKTQTDLAGGKAAKFHAEMEEDKAEAMDEGNKVTKESGKSAKDAALGMVALGAAIMMIGVGIGAAAMGLATLVQAFNGLENAGPALLAITLVLGAFVAMVYILATASAIAAGPIGLLGLAFLGIGAGIFLAAYGMSLLVKAIGGLAGHAAEVAEAFASIVGSLIKLALPAMAAAFSMMLLAKSAIVAAPAMLSLLVTLTLSSVVMLAASYTAGLLAGVLSGMAIGINLLNIGFKTFTELLIRVTPSLVVASLAVAAMALSMVLLAKSLFVGIPALYGMGAVLYSMAGAFLFASLSAAILAASIEKIADSTITIGANRDGLDAVTDVVKLGAEVSPANMEALDEALNKVVNVMVESRTANAPAIQALANAVAPSGGGGGGGGAAAAAAGGTTKTVQLVLNQRVFGEVVVDVLNDKYDLTAGG